MRLWGVRIIEKVVGSHVRYRHACSVLLRMPAELHAEVWGC
jgi:hypothetical protein